MASTTTTHDDSYSNAETGTVSFRTPWGWADVLAIAIWTAVVVWFFRDVLLLGKALFYFDITEINLPYRIFFAEELRAGRFSRWCPGLYCGLPLFSESQAGYLHPLKYFLYPWMASWRAFNFDTVLSIWLTGLGTYGWLRRHVGAAGALTGAAVFGAGGFVWAHFVHTSMINALASVPYIVWGLESSWESRRWRGAVLAGFAIAFQVFAGHLQDVFLSCGVVGLYGLYRAATETTRRARLGAFGVSLTAILVGCLVGGVQWIPSKELLDRSPRAGGLTWDKLTFASWHPELLPALVVREAYGTRAQDTDWMDGFYPYHEMDSYLGLIALGLAVIGAGGIYARDRWASFWVILAALGGILMLGRFTFLFDFAHRIPMAGSSREPVRFHLWVSLAVAALAALGVDRLSRPGKVSIRGAYLLALVLVAVSIPILAYVYSPIWTEPDRWRDQVHLDLFRRLRNELIRATVRTTLLAGSAAIVIRWAAGTKSPSRKTLLVWALPLLVLADLFGAHSEDVPSVDPSYWTQPPETAIRLREDPSLIRIFGLADRSAAEPGYAPEPLAFLKPRERSGFEPSQRRREESKAIDFMKVRDPLDWSLPIAFGLRTARGETPMISRRMLDYTDNAVIGHGRFDIESVSHLLPGRRSSAASSLPGEVVGTAIIHKNRGVLPRARLAGKPVYVKDQAAAGQALADPSIDPRTHLIVEDPDHPLPTDAEIDPNGFARIVQEIPERLIIETKSASPSYLVLSDTFDPGWSALLDGNPVVIRPAYSAFRAVYVPAGEHTVEMTYRPAGFMLGLILSTLGLVVSAILWTRSGPIADFRPGRGELSWPRYWRSGLFFVLVLIVLGSAVSVGPGGRLAIQTRWSQSWHGFTWGAGIEAMRQMRARQ
jgi:hypothetical protein